MKKYLMVSFVFVCLLILSGCFYKKQTLTCERSENTMKVSTGFLYVNDKPTGMNLVYELDLSQYNDIQIEAVGKQDFCNTLKTSLTQYGDAFNNCRQEIVNKKLFVRTDIEISKLSDGVQDSMTTLENAKKSMESASYTCTVK